MKSKIVDPYTLRLIKENFFSITSFIIFILLIVFVVRFQIEGVLDFRQKINTLRRELGELESKKDIVYSYKSEELDALVTTINTLLPLKEDYFSMMNALENISAKTGFRIISYAVRFAKGTKDKISLKIEGEGSPDAMINFLESYRYQGGRLITMDKIEFSPATAKTTLTLNFYAKEVRLDTNTSPRIDKKMLDLVKKVASEIQSGSKTATSSAETVIYSVKENPFEL